MSEVDPPRGRGLPGGGGASPAGVIFKVGGALVESGDAAAWVAELLRRLRERDAPRLLLVPGGGSLAEAVRERYRRGEVGLAESHWLAIGALDRMAERIAGLVGGGVTASDVGEAERLRRTGRLPVLRPGPLLRRHDPLPHSWEVTSDCVAWWCGRKLSFERVVLVKARGLPPGPLPARRAAELGLVDLHLPRLLRASGAPAPGCWLLDGRRPDRIGTLLRGDPPAGTRLS